MQAFGRLLARSECRTHKARLDEAVRAIDATALRRILAAVAAPAFVCRNAVIADYNPVLAPRGTAAHSPLGAGGAADTVYCGLYCMCMWIVAC